MSTIKVEMVRQVRADADILVIPTELKTMLDVAEAYPLLCGYESYHFFEEYSLRNGMGSIDYFDELMVPIKFVSPMLGLYATTDNNKGVTLQFPDGVKAKTEFNLNYLPVSMFEGLHDGDTGLFRVPYRMYNPIYATAKDRSIPKFIEVEFLMELTLSQKKYLGDKKFEEWIFYMLNKYNTKHPERED